MNERSSVGKTSARRKVTEAPPHLEGVLFEETEHPSMRRVLLAALDAFAELGYRGTATRDIARRAQVSAGGLYTHYESKQALLFHIIGVTHQAMLLRMRTARDEGGTPTECLRRIVKAHVRFHAKYNTATRVANYELHSLAAPAHKEIRGLRDDMEEIVSAVIAQGCATGEFVVRDQQLVTMCTLSMGIDVSRWFRPGHRLRPDELADEYARLVLQAISPVAVRAIDQATARRDPRTL